MDIPSILIKCLLITITTREGGIFMTDKRKSVIKMFAAVWPYTIGNKLQYCAKYEIATQIKLLIECSFNSLS